MNIAFLISNINSATFWSKLLFFYPFLLELEKFGLFFKTEEDVVETDHLEIMKA